MKLQGILSSKGRRAVWEKNNSGPPPDAEAPAVEVQPGPDGTMVIRGRRYSPEAAAIYQKHGAVHMICGDTAVSGINDPWLSRGQPVTEPLDADAALRAEQVQAYYDQQRRRPEARRAAGTSNWMTEP